MTTLHDLLDNVATSPEAFTYPLFLTSKDALFFRPLLPGDIEALAGFLGVLSSRTRMFCTYPGYDRATAQEMCDAIARYDKLRMVAVPAIGPLAVFALFELSLDLSPSDLARYRAYGVDLLPDVSCRFGPCIADAYQNRGLGSLLWPCTLDLIRRLGRQQILLWGGVLADNARAIHFYQKHGFQMKGEFRNAAGKLCYDMLMEC